MAASTLAEYDSRLTMKVSVFKKIWAQTSGYNGAPAKQGRLRAWFAYPEREQSRGEEIANSISHGVALACCTRRNAFPGHACAEAGRSRDSSRAYMFFPQR